MAAYKGQYFFQEFSQGWTETYYVQAASITAAAQSFSLFASSVLACRAANVTLTSVRVTNDTLIGPRITQRVIVNQAGGRPFPAFLGGEAEDVAATAAMVLLSFNDGTQKQIMLRGLLDTDVARSALTGAPIPQPALLGAVTQFINACVANGICGRRQDQTQLKVPVNAVQADVSAGLTDLLGPTLPPLAAGNIIRLSGAPLVKIPWAKGLWTVASGGNTFVSIRYPYPLAAPLLPLGMFVQKVGYGYPNVLTGLFQDFRTRKTGRPTSLIRGRARGVPYRRSLRVGG